MKKSDLITAALIAIIGTIAAYFLVDSLMGNPEEETVSFKYVGNELTGLAVPDSEVFNDSAINPTVDVYVGNCVDQNQDGTIDEAEKIVCGAATIEEAEEQAGKATANSETSEDDVDRTFREINQQNILNSQTSEPGTSSTSGTGTGTNTSGTGE
ncbi:hypothetical protein IJG21_00240 [Candidatus Saccharibacteria bacterium]|nr:hypothetical protein [Candidatus Saccharibacteria bacterium]